MRGAPEYIELVKKNKALSRDFKGCREQLEELQRNWQVRQCLALVSHRGEFL